MKITIPFNKNGLLFLIFIMLISLLIVPLIGSLLLLLIPENNPQNEEKMKVIALSTSLVNLFISILLWIQFDSSVSDYQFILEFNELSFCHLNIGVDGISLYYVLLTTCITPIALLSNYKNIYKNLKYFLISFLILETLQIALFVVLDLFLFYIFFESVLPILFIIIIVYGSGVNRIRSALLFFLYTLAGSLFMLLAILQIYSYVGSTDFQFLSLNEISLESQKILWLSVSFSKRNFSYVLYKPFNTIKISQSWRSYLFSSNQKIVLTNRYFQSESKDIQFKINPVKIYENADVSKLDVISENKNKSGVYRWLNLLTGKSYIGSSVNLTKRFYDYYNLSHLDKRKKNSIIYSSLLKNGHSNFKLEILEYCDKSIVREKEINYIILLKPEYNILNNEGLGYTHSEEGYKSTPVYRHSDLTRTKISEAAFNRKENQSIRSVNLPKLSEVFKQSSKLQVHLTSLTLRNSYKVEITNIDTNITNSYDSVRRAAEALNCSHNTIKKYSTKQKILKNKYQIKILCPTGKNVEKDITKNMTSRIIQKNKNTLNLFERFPRTNKNYLPNNNKCKDIVIYGSNLTSTVNYPRYNSIIRHMVHIPSNLYSIILGVLLSDGWLYINKSGNTLLGFKQSINKSEFFFSVFNKFSHYCSAYPILTSTTIKGNKFVGIQFATRVFPCFTEWYNIFYKNNKKIVPLDLYNLLTYEALAYWIMGGGTRNVKGLTLQTQSFNIKEVTLIVSIFIHKFNLKCSIHMQRNQPTIYISTTSMKEIRDKLIPYFCPSMYYKL